MDCLQRIILHKFLPEVRGRPAALRLAAASAPDRGAFGAAWSAGAEGAASAAERRSPLQSEPGEVSEMPSENVESNIIAQHFRISTGERPDGCIANVICARSVRGQS